MNKTQAGRLLTLAYFLKTRVKPENFDMRHIAACFVDDNMGLDQPRCGTAACAMGWATVVFPDRFALRESVDDDDRQLYGLRCSRTGREISELSRETQAFFGVNYDEATFLFSYAHSDRTPKQEAKAIEQLVADHGWTYAN